LKSIFRAEGVTLDTFDRKAHGLTMKGGKLVEKTSV
jgi:hypothetical protein